MPRFPNEKTVRFLKKERHEKIPEELNKLGEDRERVIAFLENLGVFDDKDKKAVDRWKSSNSSGKT